MFKNTTVIFALVYACICIAFGFIEQLNSRPQGVHQWAQADRASIARNYAEEDMNFLLPRVHNRLSETGITGVEFPIIQYMTAICYKLFGFNEFWYRFLMFLMVSLGVFFAFKTSLPFLENKTWIAICIITIWYCSPTLVFYTPNFIPDAASLGLCLTAWYFFFRYINTQKRLYLLFIFIFLTLSSLIKITSLIGSIVILAVCIVSLIQKNLFEISKRLALQLMTMVFLSISITCIWYVYASWLNTNYGSEIFMLRLNPIKNLNEIPIDFSWLMVTWGSDYYSHFSLYTGVWLLLFCIINYKTVNKLLFTITLLYTIGSLMFMILMMKQFLVHDYYIITLLPTAFFLLLTFSELFYRIHKNYIQLYKKQLTAGLLVLTLGSFLFAKINNNKRYVYDTGTIFSPEQMQGMEEYLRSIGISKNDKVISMYDVSPNVSLYFFNVKGVTFNPKIMADSLIVAQQSKKMDYLITTGDTVNVKYLKSATKIGAKNGILVYKFDE